MALLKTFEREFQLEVFYLLQLSLFHIEMSQAERVEAQFHHKLPSLRDFLSVLGNLAHIYLLNIAIIEAGIPRDFYNIF